MLGFIFAGFVTVMAFLMLMIRTDILKWLGYANIVDIVFTVIMIYLFHDTFSGVVAAAAAGVIMSAMLWMMRSAFGYKRLQCVREGFKLGFQWVYTAPSYRKAA